MNNHLHFGQTFHVAAASLLFALPAVAQTGQSTVIPADTPIEIRLTERLSTQHSKVGSDVHAILVAPVLSGDSVLLPPGSQVAGKVVHVNSVGLGFGHETSSIGIAMNRVILPDGSVIPLAARVAQIENSREVIDKKGRIAGVRSTSTLSHKASGAIGNLALSNPIALIFTTASSASLLRFSDPEITLPANTELVLLTTQPITAGSVSGVSTPALASSVGAQLALSRAIRRQPFRTETDAKHVPSDITNLMLIGEGAAILRALDAAGWTQVDSLNAASTYRTIRSISEQQGYRTAPMSTLLLEGERPTYTLAKTLDTFSKRHHLRIFATRDEWQNEHVWLSSATQDIGIGFSSSQKTFIHQIDHNIDHERTKVVNDLMLTGCVEGLNLVARPWLPKNPRNGTGEEIVTDTRIAVVRIGSCDRPMHAAAADQTVSIPMHQNKVVNAVRQTTLTLRSMLLRDNLAVTAYGGVRAGLGLKHPKPPEQPLAVSSSIDQSRYRVGEAGDIVEDRAALKQRTMADEPAFSPAVVPKPTPEARFPPYTVELGFHGGFTGYAGGNGAAIGYLITPPSGSPTPFYLLAFGNEMNSGFNLGGSVTLNTHEHFSHEFTFDYDRTGFVLKFADLNLSAGQDTTDPVSISEFAFEPVTLATSEVGYNLQYSPVRRTSRWRPYVSAGPSLRLMHLTDAPITKASPWFRLGLSTVGAITAAYKFGSTPPLEGGGIFQVGLQYGAGVKYRASRHVLLRADYKETLTSQPDFWSKSKNDIFSPDQLPGYSLTILGPYPDGAMRMMRATAGISFVF